MATTPTYRAIVQAVLRPFTGINYVNGSICNETLFDVASDRYAVMSVGWEGPKRIHSCLIHIDIIHGKVWIQWDGTEEGIADLLEEAGIPKEAMVLGFHPQTLRPLTDYAPG
jgi:hypothetical protein